MKQLMRFIFSCVWSPSLLLQIVLVLILGRVNEDRLNTLVYAAGVMWWILLLFGWLPIIVFKRKGGVPKGKSFVHTATLVDTGLYSVIRHQEYTAGILWSITWVFFFQKWLIAIIGAAVIILLYLDILMADKYEIEKFGDSCKRYMQEVPGVIFLLGFIRLLKRRRKRISQ